MSDLGTSERELSPKQQKPLSSVVGSYTYFGENDVLLAKITPCFENGKLGIARSLANRIGFGSSEFMVLRPSSGILPEFVYYYLSQAAFRRAGASLMTGAVGHKRVPKDFVEGYEIPVPPLPEQQRIVAILDEAFEGIATATANAEKNLAGARGVFESHLNHLFSDRGPDWIEESIGQNIKFIDYRGKTPPKRDAGIRLITAKNIKMGYIQRQPEEFVDPAAYDHWMTRGFPRKGDVLFTTEAPLGNIAQLDTDERVIVGQRLITMQTEPAVLDQAFLKYMLLSAPLQKAIRLRATGATVQGIKASLLKQVKITYPASISEQQARVRSLDALSEQIEQLKRVYVRKLAALAELKQSLLARAFSGELTAGNAIAA